MNRVAYLFGFVLICAASHVSIADEAKYVPVLRLLTTQGTYESNEIGGPYPDGISRTECELRIEAWVAKFGEMFEAVRAQMRREGKTTAFRTECVAKR